MQLPAKQDAKGEAKQDTKAEAKPDAKTGAGPAGPTPSAGPPALNAGPPNASPAAKTPSAPSLAPPPASSAAPAAPVAAAAPAAAAPALAAPAASVPAAQLASASSTPSSGPGAGGLAGLPPDSGLVRSLQAQLAELRSAVRDIQGELQDLRSHVDDRVAGPAGDAAAARSAADRALQETVSNRLEVDALRDRLKDVARALAGRVERGEAAGRAALDDAGARWARDLERLEGLVDEGARAGALLEERMAAEAREAQERFQRLLEDCKRHADAGDARLKAWNEEGRKALLSSLEHTWNKCQDGIKAVSEEAKARNEKVTKSVQEGLRRFEEQATRMRASADEIGRGLSERIAGTARDTRAANESLRALVESQIRAARAAVGDEVAAARDECARLGHHVESQLEIARNRMDQRESIHGSDIAKLKALASELAARVEQHRQAAADEAQKIRAWAGGEVAAVRSAVDSGLQAVREEDQRLRTSLQSAGDGMLERVQSAIRGQQEEAARAAKWLQERTEWLQKRSEEEWTTVAAQDAKLRERIEQEQAELRAQVDRRKKELEAEEEALRGWAEGQRAWIGAQCDALRAVDKEIREWLGDRLTAQQQRSDAFEAACARAIRDENGRVCAAILLVKRELDAMRARLETLQAQAASGLLGAGSGSGLAGSGPGGFPTPSRTGRPPSRHPSEEQALCELEASAGAQLLDLADTDIVEADRKPLTASFCGRPLGPRGAAMVADAINASALQVCVLDVRDARLGDRGAEILASQLAPASGSRIAAHLAELRMAGNGLGPRGVEALAEPLATNTVLKALDLSRNDCSHVGARALAAALQGNRTLTSLTLDDCKLVSTDVAALAAALDGNATLLHLSLAENPYCTDLGAEEIASRLRKNRTLTHLNVAGCNINQCGAQCFAEVLRQPGCAITRLSAARNGIGEGGAADLAAALLAAAAAPAGTPSQPRPAGLTYLDLSGNGVTPRGASELAKALRHAGATLGELQLGDNPLGNEGARYLAEAVRDGARVAALGLAACRITDDGAGYLAVALGELRPLTALDLTRNTLSQNAVNVLKEAATVREGRCGVRTDLGAFGGSGAAEGGSAGPGPGPVPSPRVELGPHPDTEAARRRAIKERDLDDLISTLSLGPAPAAY